MQPGHDEPRVKKVRFREPTEQDFFPLASTTVARSVRRTSSTQVRRPTRREDWGRAGEGRRASSRDRRYPRGERVRVEEKAGMQERTGRSRQRDRKERARRRGRSGSAGCGRADVGVLVNVRWRGTSNRDVLLGRDVAVWVCGGCSVYEVWRRARKACRLLREVRVCRKVVCTDGRHFRKVDFDGRVGQVWERRWARWVFVVERGDCAYGRR